jgi:NADH-quinone oxidoreductase subunit A
MAESTYWSLLIVGFLALLIPVLFLALGNLLGPKPAAGRSDELDKMSAFECGIVPEVDARRRFSAKFYLVAVLFVLFDVEVAFLIPWAVSFREMSSDGGVGWWAFLSMALFLGTLMGGLVYLVRRGALEWE